MPSWPSLMQEPRAGWKQWLPLPRCAQIPPAPCVESGAFCFTSQQNSSSPESAPDRQQDPKPHPRVGSETPNPTPGWAPSCSEVPPALRPSPHRASWGSSTLDPPHTHPQVSCGCTELLRALLTLCADPAHPLPLLLSLPCPAQCHSSCSSCSYSHPDLFNKRERNNSKRGRGKRDEKAALSSFMQFNTYTLAQIKLEPGLQSAFLGTVTAPGQAQSLLNTRVHEALNTTCLSQPLTCLPV